VEHCIIVGCDVHSKNTLLKAAADRDEPVTRLFRSNRRGRAKMLGWLREWSARLGGARVVVVYESSLMGFVLYDAVVAAALECYVLATSKLARSWKNRVQKTDERDAQMLFEQARAHVLAGNPLPVVVVADPELRDHREVTRARTDLAQKVTRVKNQVQGLLKRYGLERPAGTGKSWTKAFRAWLDGLVGSEQLGWGARVALSTLVAQLRSLDDEVKHVDEHLAALAQHPRHAAAAEAIAKFPGVSVGVALTFLTEMGDLERFPNRRCLASYLGLVPRSDESGETDDRKGHITHHGPPRVRRALCLAVQHWIRWSPAAKARYKRLVARGGRRCKKIAKVALMRLLGIRLWHAGLNAQGVACAAGGPCG
jgi:transposase